MSKKRVKTKFGRINSQALNCFKSFDIVDQRRKKSRK